MILRAGSGILYAHWGCDREGSEAMAEALERIRGWAIGAGGSLTLESAPLWLKERMDVWGPPGKEISLMRGLKRHFDFLLKALACAVVEKEGVAV